MIRALRRLLIMAIPLKKRPPEGRRNGTPQARVATGADDIGHRGLRDCRKSDAEVKKEIDRICEVKDTAGYFGFKDFTTQSKLGASYR